MCAFERNFFTPNIINTFKGQTQKQTLQKPVRFINNPTI